MATQAADPGLSSREAAARLGRGGPRDRDTGSRSYVRILRDNAFTLVNAITLGFLILIAAAGAWHDAVFAAVIVVNLLIGVAQQVRAKRKLDRLALLVAPRAHVRRDGTVVELAPEEVVEGDVVELQPGDQIVADGAVVEARGLAVDESILTGESNTVARVLGDELMSGSYCAVGAGAYRVTRVGADAYANRLTATARQAATVRSPLEQEIDRLLRLLLLVMLPLAAALIGALVLHDIPFRSGAQTATAGLISLVPEGLVLLASVTFAAAATRVARWGALVQQLNAVESLASVDTVCLDKTGTLTDGALELVDVVAAPGVDPAAARSALARLAASGSVRSATSDAIVAKLGGEPGEEPRAEIGFSSRWKWSGVELRDGALVLGAPEVLGAGDLATTVAERQAQRERVLVFAHAAGLPPEPAADEAPPLPPGLVVLGLAVLAERMRPDAAEVVAFMRREGIDVKIMSGDAPATVGAVAIAAGLGDVAVVSGSELPRERDVLDIAARRYAVFARVTPEQKEALVRSLQRQGRYVAMIGDGVNDVPAMKAARLAIAQGAGSQIARGVSDIVLVGGEFSVIPRAIVEGRRILSNLRRVAKLFVVKSAFAGTLILTVGVAGAAYPLLPRQLTLAAILTVGIPSFVLALGPSTGRPPELSFTRDLARFAVPCGIVSALAVLAAYGATRSLPGRDVGDARTVAYVVLVITGLYLILLLEDEALTQSNRRRAGVGALVTILLALLVASVVLPPVRAFFDLSALGIVDTLLAILASVFAVGALGLAGFRTPLLARRLFG